MPGDQAVAHRLLLVWLVSTVVLTLAPFGPLRDDPLTLEWVAPSTSKLGNFDLAANVLLFLPLGIFGVAAGGPRGAVFVAGVLLSLVIESAQGWIPLRHPSGDDLATNGLGTLLGAIFSTPLLRLGRMLDRRALRCAALVAGGATAALLSWRYPQIRRYTLLYPFALSVLGSLLAAKVLRPRPAALLVAATAGAMCTPLFPAPDPGCWVACLAGAALGAWPYEQPLPRTRTDTTRTVP